MKALVFERNLPRFAASRVASLLGSGRGAGVGPLQLLDRDAPELPGKDWFHLTPLLSGICGSDLSTLDGRSSRYFEHLVSFPFVPGHEVVGILEAGGRDRSGRVLPAGTRAVIEPVLGCAPRQIRPPCPYCNDGHTGLCGNVSFGELEPGLQTGFCADTGGGWSTAPLCAHSSQLHGVPEGFSDDDAVMIEPTACAVHAVLSAGVADGDLVAVVGAGTLGLACTAALDKLIRPQVPCTVMVGAKYGHQRSRAEALGADGAVAPEHLARAVRRRSGSLVVGGRLTDGADVVLDCVGSSDSLTAALGMVRPRGRIVLVGMPGRINADLAPLWHREVSLVGAYAYGTEHSPEPGEAGQGRESDNAGEPGESGEGDGGRASPRTFDLAISLVAAARLGSLVSAGYPLERYDEAIAHAGTAGRRGAVKVVFDLRNRKGRTR